MSVKTKMIREKLHQFVDTIEDKKAIAPFRFFEDEIDVDSQRKKLIFAERKRVMSGELKTYKWEEVKTMVKNKKLRNGL
jgi:hypothetical protein